MSLPPTGDTPWLLLVFSLPPQGRPASALMSGENFSGMERWLSEVPGHVLPNTPENQERMEWLATAIRTYKGQASVVASQGFRRPAGGTTERALHRGEIA